MNIDQLREYCLSKPDTEEGTPFGDDTLVFKTGGKIFLLCGLDDSPLQFNVKCDPALAIELREQYPCVIPGYHMNKKHWNTIIADGSANIILLKSWIDHSYELVNKKKNNLKIMGTNINLDSQYWQNRYQSNTHTWDLGEVSPPLKKYIDGLPDKNIRILIPGCGNSYEADYLLQNGFTNVTVIDIAPVLVSKLQEKYARNSHIKILLGDFFEHRGEYDLILEQTFFCALDPALRTKYRDKMFSLLSAKGKLVGLLFDTQFEKVGPPFGGSKAEYENLFKDHFELLTFEKCYNSFSKRQDTELFIILKKLTK